MATHSTATSSATATTTLNTAIIVASPGSGADVGARESQYHVANKDIRTKHIAHVAVVCFYTGRKEVKNLESPGIEPGSLA